MALLGCLPSSRRDLPISSRREHRDIDRSTDRGRGVRIRPDLRMVCDSVFTDEVRILPTYLHPYRIDKRFLLQFNNSNTY